MGPHLVMHRFPRERADRDVHWRRRGRLWGLRSGIILISVHPVLLGVLVIFPKDTEKWALCGRLFLAEACLLPEVSLEFGLRIIHVHVEL